MKYIVGILFMFSPMNSFGQILSFKEIPMEILREMDQMGVDSLPVLNLHEGRYLNEIFKENLKGFDFIGKKIGFLHRGYLSDKQEYFAEVRERFNRNSTPVGGSSVYILDAEQKTTSGGYDAVVVYWSKVSISTEKLIQKLKHQKF